jgi:hypothetical protein
LIFALIDFCLGLLRASRFRLSRSQNAQIVSGIRVRMIAQRKTVRSTLDNPDERIAMGRFHLNPTEKAKPNPTQYDLPRQAGIIHPDEPDQVFRGDWRRFQRINRDRLPLPLRVQRGC